MRPKGARRHLEFRVICRGRKPAEGASGRELLPLCVAPSRSRSPEHQRTAEGEVASLPPAARLRRRHIGRCNYEPRPGAKNAEGFAGECPAASVGQGDAPVGPQRPRCRPAGYLPALAPRNTGGSEHPLVSHCYSPRPLMPSCPDDVSMAPVAASGGAVAATAALGLPPCEVSGDRSEAIAAASKAAGFLGTEASPGPKRNGCLMKGLLPRLALGNLDAVGSCCSASARVLLVIPSVASANLERGGAEHAPPGEPGQPGVGASSAHRMSRSRCRRRRPPQRCRPSWRVISDAGTVVTVDVKPSANLV